MTICPDNYNYSRFKLKDKCRSEKWEVYLYGDMTIMVMGPDVQKTAEVSAVAFYGVTGRLFWAVYTGTRPGVSPAIRAGKGWRGRRELAPRCSATQLGASRWLISTETCVIHPACTNTTNTTNTTKTPFWLKSSSALCSLSVAQRTCLQIMVPFCLFLCSLVLPSELGLCEIRVLELRDGVRLLGSCCDL